MATAKAAIEHGHLIPMDNEHNPKVLIVTTDEDKHYIRKLILFIFQKYVLAS